MNERFELNTDCDIEEQKKNADIIVKYNYDCKNIKCKYCPIMKYNNHLHAKSCGSPTPNTIFLELRKSLINKFYLEYYRIKIEKALNIREIKFNTEGKDIKQLVEFAKKIRDNNYCCINLTEESIKYLDKHCSNYCPLNGIHCWVPTTRKNLIDLFIEMYEPTIKNNAEFIYGLREKNKKLEEELESLKYEYSNLQ
ncbi:hypothetical protein EOM09_05985, partial [bacterium]|nr:hypothetical protein [bacterium]